MQILSLLGMYFDAAVVFVTKFLLLFRLTLPILCVLAYKGFFTATTINDLLLLKLSVSEVLWCNVRTWCHGKESLTCKAYIPEEFQ